jgi:RHS repeat-associated protein
VYASQGHVPDLVVRSGVTYRLITDQLGSVRAVVEVSGGTILQQIDYDPWGGRTTDSAPGIQAIGYAGGVSDPSTKLVRFGARDYDPTVGRWTAKDPVIFRGGTNQFAYVDNIPTQRIDPSGLCTLQLGLSLNFVIGGVAGTVSAGFAVDQKGNIAGYQVKGPGVGVGEAVAGGLTVAVSDAGTVGGLSQYFTSVSASGGTTVGATVEYFQGSGDSPSGTVHGVGATLGGVAGGGAAGLGTWTDITPVWGPMASGDRGRRR